MSIFLNTTTSFVEDLTRVKHEILETTEKISEISQNLALSFSGDEDLVRQIDKLCGTLEDARATLDEIETRVRNYDFPIKQDEDEDDEVEIKLETYSEDDIDLPISDPLSVPDIFESNDSPADQDPSEDIWTVEDHHVSDAPPSPPRTNRRKQKLSQCPSTYEPRPEPGPKPTNSIPPELPSTIITGLKGTSSNKTTTASSLIKKTCDNKSSKNVSKKSVLLDKVVKIVLEKCDQKIIKETSHPVKYPVTDNNEIDKIIPSEVSANNTQRDVRITPSKIDDKQCRIGGFIPTGQARLFKLNMFNHQLSHRREKSFSCKFCHSLHKTNSTKNSHQSRCCRNPKKLLPSRKNHPLVTRVSNKSSSGEHETEPVSKITVPTYTPDEIGESKDQTAKDEAPDLENMTELVDSNSTEAVKCDICGFIPRGVNVVINLSNHKLIHLNDKKFSCKFCGRLDRASRLNSLHQYRCRSNPLNTKLPETTKQTPSSPEKITHPDLSMDENIATQDASNGARVTRQKYSKSERGLGNECNALKEIDTSDEADDACFIVNEEDDSDTNSTETEEDFKLKKKRVSHKSVKSSKASLLCGKCGKQFRSAAGCKYHCSKQCSPGGNKVECPKKCGRLLYKNSVATHARACTGIPPPVNPNEITGPPWICPICKRVFTSKSSVLCHANTHFPKKDFKCTFCKKEFRRKAGLVVHMNVHTDARIHKCDLCPKTFNYREVLAKHKRNVHSENTRTEQCYICGALFKERNLMQRHIRKVHEQDRPHKCPRCDKCFKEKPHLKYHLKTHDNPKSKKRGLNKVQDCPKPKRMKQPDGNQILKSSLQDVQKPTECDNAGNNDDEQATVVEDNNNSQSEEIQPQEEHQNPPSSSWFLPVL